MIDRLHEYNSRGGKGWRIHLDDRFFFLIEAVGEDSYYSCIRDRDSQYNKTFNVWFTNGDLQKAIRQRFDLAKDFFVKRENYFTPESLLSIYKATCEELENYGSYIDFTEPFKCNVFPMDYLEIGMNVIIDHQAVDGYEGTSVVVTGITPNKATGRVRIPFEEELGDEITFSYGEVRSRVGSSDWNKRNLLVSVSARVLLGEDIGYFYECTFWDRQHYGIAYYAESEKHHDKTKIQMHLIKLGELLDLIPEMGDYLKSDLTYGCISEHSGQFKLLNERDIIDKDREVFPCACIIDEEEEIVMEEEAEDADARY